MSGNHQTLTLVAEKRTVTKGSDLHHLRAQGRIPAIVYGAHTESTPVHVAVKDVQKIASRGSSEIFNLSVDGQKPSQAIIKEMQTKSGALIHIDLQLLRADERIRLHVPIEYEGTAIGTQKGGILQIQETQVEIECMPGQIPAAIHVDLSPLDIGGKILAGTLTMPEGVHLISHPDELLVSIVVPRGAELKEIEAMEAAEAEAAE